MLSRAGPRLRPAFRPCRAVTDPPVGPRSRPARGHGPRTGPDAAAGARGDHHLPARDRSPALPLLSLHTGLLDLRRNRAGGARPPARGLARGPTPAALPPLGCRRGRPRSAVCPARCLTRWRARAVDRDSSHASACRPRHPCRVIPSAVRPTMLGMSTDAALRDRGRSCDDLTVQRADRGDAQRGRPSVAPSSEASSTAWNDAGREGPDRAEAGELKMTVDIDTLGPVDWLVVEFPAATSRARSGRPSAISSTTARSGSSTCCC
jgi:hypothetical protein